MPREIHWHAKQRGITRVVVRDNQELHDTIGYFLALPAPRCSCCGKVIAHTQYAPAFQQQLAAQNAAQAYGSYGAFWNAARGIYP